MTDDANTAVPEQHGSQTLYRSIDLDVDIGADAVDYNAIAKQESLSGLEVEMRKLEGIVNEIVDELNYLKRREARMRDTNGSFAFFFLSFVTARVAEGALYRAPLSVGASPAFSNSPLSLPSSALAAAQTESTNDRVRNFFFLTFSTLILLGVWQILHLRSYFKKSEFFVPEGGIRVWR